MRGPRLFDHTNWKSKKKGLHVLRCRVFTENFGIVKSKKKVCTSSDVLFSTESIGEKKKKVLIVRDEHPIFCEGLRFSLLSLYINPALCLQSWASAGRGKRGHLPPLKKPKKLKKYA